MTRQQDKNKSNPFLLSEQVKRVLKSKGFTSIFNYSDYTYFKSQCKDAFNKAIAIADCFINDADSTQNDLNDYIF